MRIKRPTKVPIDKIDEVANQVCEYMAQGWSVRFSVHQAGFNFQVIDQLRAANLRFREAHDAYVKEKLDQRSWMKRAMARGTKVL